MLNARRRRQQGGAHEREREVDPLFAWIAEHAPLLGTVLIFSLTIVRVLRVASFDPATATALVHASGLVSIVMGVLVTSFPAILLGTVLYLIFLAQGGPGSPVQRRAAWLVALVIYVLLTVLLPWPRLLIVTAFFVVIFFVQRRLRWELELFAVVAFLVTNLLDVPTVWLPPERVEVSGSTPVTAYVLAVDSDWTTLLLDADRRVLVVPTSQVNARTVCNVEHVTTSRTISQVILGEAGGARNPPCP
jgi:hypothetical protein